MITRAQVQAKAREFVGTPFVKQHRAKGVGIDCVGLILLVAEELEISYNDTQEMRGSDYRNYSDSGLNSFVLDECRSRLIEKPVMNLKPGDVLVMRVPDVPCHCGIVTEVNGVLYMVHAYNTGPKKVVEHILDAAWRRRICGVFSYPGTED